MAESLKAKTPDSILENNKIKAIYPQIIVTGEIDKPYYSIAYYDTAKKEWYIGYSSYDLKNVRQWFDEFFEEVEGDIAEVVHGEWIAHGYKWRCSVCNCKLNLDGTPMENGFYFCPICGAKMDANSKTNLSEATRQTVIDSFMKGSKD